VRNSWVAITGVAFVVTACASAPDYHPAPGTLTAGTAHVTVNGRDAGTTDAVACNTTGWLTTITTGDHSAGVTAMISNQKGLVAESVNINNLGGFTGSYNNDLGGAADVTMREQTYYISGTADGFNTDNPSFRKSGTFAIKVAC
jgi:hypothetical protein